MTNSSVSISQNDGNVLIVGDSGSNFNFGAVGANVEVPIIATLPLFYSVADTQFPKTVQGIDSDIYRVGSDTWVENPIDKQEHLWRFVVEYQRTNSSADEIIELHIINPDAGSSLDVFYGRPLERTTGVKTTTFLINLTADSFSLLPIASGAGGYKFSLISSASLDALNLLSLKRISLINSKNVFVDIS